MSTQTSPFFADSRYEALGTALGACAGSLCAEGGRAWSFTLPGLGRRATARLDARWLELEMPIGASRGVSLAGIRRYLRRNARSGGFARIVGVCGAERARVAVDMATELLCWSDSTALAARLELAIASMRAAALGRAPGDLQHGSSKTDCTALEPLFDEAGWPAQTAPGGSLHVLLDVPGFYADAVVTVCGGRVEIVARVLEAEFAEAPPTGRDAVACLLWNVASSCRMVKPSLTSTGPALAVAVAAEPAALAHACSALSVALASTLQEASSLASDEELARTYLTVIGLDRAKTQSGPARSRA